MYVPGSMPSGDLHQYLGDELAKISAVLQVSGKGMISKVYKAPTKPREGMVRIADGSHWNPGNGAGVYYYNEESWHFLG